MPTGNGENNQKIKLLRIMEILQQETDEEHPLKTSDICARLLSMHITCDTRTLGKDISSMKDAGGIICIPSGQGRSCTDRAIQEILLNKYLRRTCFQSTILPEGRDTRFGACRGILCRTPF